MFWAFFYFKKSLHDEDFEGGKTVFGNRIRPESVKMVPGSTAGANSHTFHVYRQARRREEDRQIEMESHLEEDVWKGVHDDQVKEWAEEDAAKTEKKRLRRQKRKKLKKEAKMKAEAVKRLVESKNSKSDDNEQQKNDTNEPPIKKAST